MCVDYGLQSGLNGEGWLRGYCKHVSERSVKGHAGGLVYLAHMNPWLAASTALVSFFLCFFAGWYGKFARKMQRAYQDALADTNQVLPIILVHIALA